MLTLFLICQEMYHFFAIKPTTTSQEEKELRTSDIPETVLCADPGFDGDVLQKYGYKTNTYYRGSMDTDKFVGWNGGKNENKTSNAVLEETLRVNIIFRSLFHSIFFAKDYVSNRVKADTEFRKLVYPHGRCLSIIPPGESLNNTRLNSLTIVVNNTAVVEMGKITRLKVYFMDKVNSVRIYPNDMEMKGDRVVMYLKEKQPKVKSIKTQITRSVHVEGDPLLDCAVYTENNSYSKCAQNELFEVFTKEIGCIPPLLDADPITTCNKRFNFSAAKDKYLDTLFKPLYFHNREFKCKTPCTKNVYTSSFLHTSPSAIPSTVLMVIFDKKLEVAHSTFSIDGQTLLTRLGGSVSSGRTLLWILVSILAVSQVLPPKHLLI